MKSAAKPGLLKKFLNIIKALNILVSYAFYNSIILFLLGRNTFIKVFTKAALDLKQMIINLYPADVYDEISYKDEAKKSIIMVLPVLYNLAASFENTPRRK